MATIAVIVVGAGASTRFGNGGNKVFADLAGTPVFLRAVTAFTDRRDVTETIFVCSPDDIDRIRGSWGDRLDELSVTITTGGETRSDSVRNGVALVGTAAELVAVHDAARPCVPPPLIDAVFEKAAETGAAVPALPLRGTVKRAGPDGIVTRTLSRDAYGDLHEVQTPQVFRRDILVSAYASGTSATDDAALVEAAGGTVHLVPGDPRNIKITTPDDLAAAAAILGRDGIRP